MTAAEVVLIALLHLSGLPDQTPDVRRYVELAGAGQLDEVKKDLPGLVSAYPDDPGVMYLQALVNPEGAEAVKIYQNIVDNHPRSQWAPDALYKICQFYQALGLVRTAELKMAQLRKDYPSSRYVTGRTGAPGGGASLPPARLPSTDSLAAARASSSSPATKVPGLSPRAGDEAPNSRPFALQVGAFSTEANAGKLRSLFADRGYAVEVITRANRGRDIYLVWVGRYNSEEEARSHIAQIQEQQKITPMVVKR